MKGEKNYEKLGLAWTIISVGFAFVITAVILALNYIWPVLKDIATWVVIIVFLFLGIKVLKMGAKVLKSS